MKVIERYFGPVRRTLGEIHDGRKEMEYEAYLKVEVNGLHLHTKSLINRKVILFGGIPERVFMRKLEEQILDLIRKELFGG